MPDILKVVDPQKIVIGKVNCHNGLKRLRWLGIAILTILTLGLVGWIFWAGITGWGI